MAQTSYKMLSRDNIKFLWKSFINKLNLKAPIASPTFTGTPKTTTPAANADAAQIANKGYVDSAISSLGRVLNYQGIVATQSALPGSGATTGDVYIVSEDNSEYVWNGAAWEKFGPTIDLSGYASLNSPALTGTPTAPTPTSSSGNTQIATKEYVDNFVPDLTEYMQKGVDYVTAGARSGSTLGSKATAEGNNVDASGDNSHAGGEYSKALGRSSFAMGYGVQAKQDYIMAFGMYNLDPGYQRSWIFIMNQMATYVDNYDGTAVLFFNVHDPDTTETINNALVFDVDYSGSDITLLYNMSRSIWGPSEIQSFDPYLRVWDTQTTEPTQNLQLASRITAVPEYVHVQSPCYGLAIMYKNYQSNQVSDMESHMGYGTRLLETVGNGSSNNYSNARTLDWNGNEVLAGKLTVGVAPTNDMDVATKQYVDNAIVNDIFIATYGTTTYAEVTNALTQGKSIIANKDDRIYSFNCQDGTCYIFSTIEYIENALEQTTDITVYSLLLWSNSEWEFSSSSLGANNTDSNVFIATYGTTTYNEINAAFTAGKIVFVKYAAIPQCFAQCVGRFDSYPTAYVFLRHSALANGARFTPATINDFTTGADLCMIDDNDQWTMTTDMKLSSLNITTSLTAPTKATGTNTTDVATTAFVQQENKVVYINYANTRIDDAELVYNMVNAAYDAGKRVILCKDISYEVDSTNYITEYEYYELVDRVLEYQQSDPSDPSDYTTNTKYIFACLAYPRNSDTVWSRNTIKAKILVLQCRDISNFEMYSWQEEERLMLPAYSSLSDGTYKLQLSMSNGEPTFSWVTDN